MAYQIRKQERISEDLELMETKDHPTVLIHIDINPEHIAKDYRKVQLEIAKAQQIGDVSAFRTAVDALFHLVFGADATEKILEYFDGSYIDATLNVLPFIYDRIHPAVEAYAKNRREMLVNNVALNRRQRRKLGL